MNGVVNMLTGTYPELRFTEENNCFNCEIDLPGVEKSDIKVTYENSQFIVHAIRNVNGKTEKISRAFYANKCKDIKATTKNGVLYITGEYEQPKSVDIKWD